MKTILYILLFLGVSFGGKAQDTSPKNLFNQATQAYADEAYDKAIATYNQLLEQGQTSAALYYNLANAYYKLNQVAESIYYYEKALQLSPNDKDIHNNLSFAKNMALDAIEEQPKTGLTRIYDKLSSIFDTTTWAWLSILFMLLGSLCIGVYFFAGSSFKKRLFFSFSMLGFFLGILTSVVAFQQQQYLQANTYAIVFEEEVSVKSEPNNSSSNAFLLHAGTKVEVLDSFNTFVKIALADGREGWITEKAIKQL